MGRQAKSHGKGKGKGSAPSSPLKGNKTKATKASKAAAGTVPGRASAASASFVRLSTAPSTTRRSKAVRLSDVTRLVRWFNGEGGHAEDIPNPTKKHCLEAMQQHHSNLQAHKARVAANQLLSDKSAKRDFVATDFCIFFVGDLIVGMLFFEEAFDLHNTGADFEKRLSVCTKNKHKKKCFCSLLAFRPK
jgi:hypothetical protein